MIIKFISILENIYLNFTDLSLVNVKLSKSLYQNVQKIITSLSSIGEFGLINRIKSNFDLKSLTHTGIGDDAAVIDIKINSCIHRYVGRKHTF